MKRKEHKLCEYISEAFGLLDYKLILNYAKLKLQHKEEIIHVYRLLGGVLELSAVPFSACDNVNKNSGVELDEKQHFNSYRKLTLSTAIYLDTKWINHSRYKKYCNEYQYLCKKKAAKGEYWRNTSTEKQYDKAVSVVDFSGNESLRWKQYAFYDFCKELAGKVTAMLFFRLYFFEIVDSFNFYITLGKFLDKNRKELVIAF